MLVDTIISMAKALKIEVVAEGAEIKQEVDIWAKLGCDHIQGDYFSKPLKPEDIKQYLLEFDFSA